MTAKARKLQNRLRKHQERQQLKKEYEKTIEEYFCPKGLCHELKDTVKSNIGVSKIYK